MIYYSFCRSTEGMTPVLIAAAYGRYQALCILLDMGGDPTIFDDSGKNALEYARESNSWDCISTLKEWHRQGRFGKNYKKCQLN